MSTVIVFWTLVLIGFQGDKPMGSIVGSFPEMTTCFQAREEIMREIGPPINYQAVCVMRVVEGEET